MVTSKSKKGRPPEKKGSPDYGSVRLFVYGTLKKGHSNNIVLKSVGAKFLGYDALILPDHSFVDFGGFPGVIRHSKSSSSSSNFVDQVLLGEVYYGNCEMLKSCDILEGHPSFFKRTKQWTTIHNRRVWVYTLGEDWVGEAMDFMKKLSWNARTEEKEFWQNYYETQPKDNKISTALSKVS